MANKDLNLNPKIEKAAFEEFLNSGFRKASLKTIANNAEVTTGALYTRYKNKDDLFCSLVKDLIDEMNTKFPEIYPLYNQIEETKKVEDFLNAMSIEQSCHVELFFSYYDECRLLFCCSDGSSINESLKQIMELKIEQTCLFMTKIANKEIDKNLIIFLLKQQMNIYIHIFDEKLDKITAIEFIKKTNAFYENGWANLFKELLK